MAIRQRSGDITALVPISIAIKSHGWAKIGTNSEDSAIP
jgi:hypothetical protein